MDPPIKYAVRIERVDGNVEYAMDGKEAAQYSREIADRLAVALIGLHSDNTAITVEPIPPPTKEIEG